MIKATVYRINDKLIAADNVSLYKIMQLKDGQPYMVQIWQPRNIKLHNLYFAILRIFVNNTSLLEFMPKDDSPAAEEYAIDSFRKAVLMHLGCVELVHDIDGKTVYKTPKSISFESMDEEEFKTKVFMPTVDIICKLLNLTEEELMDMVGEYI